jgi:hypothetical protein
LCVSSLEETFVLQIVSKLLFLSLGLSCASSIFISLEGFHIIFISLVCSNSDVISGTYMYIHVSVNVHAWTHISTPTCTYTLPLHETSNIINYGKAINKKTPWIGMNWWYVCVRVCVHVCIYVPVYLGMYECVCLFTVM